MKPSIRIDASQEDLVNIQKFLLFATTLFVQLKEPIPSEVTNSVRRLADAIVACEERRVEHNKTIIKYHKDNGTTKN